MWRKRKRNRERERERERKEGEKISKLFFPQNFHFWKRGREKIKLGKVGNFQGRREGAKEVENK